MMKFTFSPVQMAMSAVLGSRRPASHEHVQLTSPSLATACSTACQGAATSRSRQRIALARTLGVVCSVCRGLGCVNCGEIGLE